MCRALRLALASFAIAISVYAEEDAAKTRLERLVGLARLWGTVRYFHPALASSDVDWDDALIRVLPRVNGARSAEDYRAATEQLLGALNDPATHVVPAKQDPDSVGEPEPTWRLGDDGILLVVVHHYIGLDDFAGVRERMTAMSSDLDRARGVVFDLRAARPIGEDTRGLLDYGFSSSGLEARLSVRSLVAPGQRSRFHVGYAPQSSSTSGDYYSAFSNRDGRRILPAPGAKDRPAAFVVNRWSELPLIAPALQAVGGAIVVADGEVGDESLVRQQSVFLPDGIEARVRLSDFLGVDGGLGFVPDLTVPRADGPRGDPALAAALAWVRSPSPLTRAALPKASLAAQSLDKPYSEMAYPAAEYRVLAAFRIFAIFSHFFPYSDLMDTTWDDVLREALPHLEAASDATDYSLALARMVASAGDSHVGVSSPSLREHFGEAEAPVALRWIEDRPVVAALLDEDAAGMASLAIGDVVLRVDGEEAAARISRLKPYFAASTPQSLMHKVLSRLLNGADGSQALLTIQDGSDRVRNVRVQRSANYRQKWQGWRQGRVFRMLSVDVGYADLDRLRVPEVEPMFEAFRGTRAIVFDMRGYPYGTAWAIAPRLSERDEVVAARIQRPLVLAPALPSGEILRERVTDVLEQRLPHTSRWRYRGRSVMLIDERTISQAEHTGLFFEAAAGTVFVGSPTAGANGDVTNLVVPGGNTIRFTGQAIHHADGRQLQRVGLQPHVPARPTVAGLRAGRDEVLEAALTYLRGALDP